MQMFTLFSSITVFFHELRNIPCYLNVVNTLLVLFYHGHEKRISKVGIKYYINTNNYIHCLMTCNVMVSSLPVVSGGSDHA